MPHMAHRLTSVILLLGSLLTACGTAAQDPAAEDPPTGTSADAPATREIDIEGFRFVPPTITVAAGTEVVWVNGDATAHTVTAGSEDDPRPERYDLAVDEEGQTVSHTYDEAGSYAYYCELHPFMEGTVEVTR
jgi:plastocyanin